MILELRAQIREKTGNQVNSLRREGLVPAVLYRKGKENINLALNYLDFDKIFKQAGESTIIKLMIEGDSAKVDVKARERNVLVVDTARDAISGNFLHIDFHEVRLDEKITAAVPLIFVGESPAVKTLDGTLVKNIQEVEVRALPNDLPRQIEVDVSGLATFDDQILIQDLQVAEQVEIMASPDEVIVLVVPPRKEEEAVVAPSEELPAEGAPAVEGISAEQEEEGP